MIWTKKSIIAILICVSGDCLLSQTPFVVIDSILMEGYRKTKQQYILQSINLRQGDTIALDQLMPILDQNQKLLFNKNYLENTSKVIFEKKYLSQ